MSLFKKGKLGKSSGDDGAEEGVSPDIEAEAEAHATADAEIAAAETQAEAGAMPPAADPAAMPPAADLPPEGGADELSLEGDLGEDSFDDFDDDYVPQSSGSKKKFIGAAVALVVLAGGSFGLMSMMGGSEGPPPPPTTTHKIADNAPTTTPPGEDNAGLPPMPAPAQNTSPDGGPDLAMADNGDLPPLAPPGMSGDGPEDAGMADDGAKLPMLTPPGDMDDDMAAADDMSAPPSFPFPPAGDDAMGDDDDDDDMDDAAPDLPDLGAPPSMPMPMGSPDEATTADAAPDLPPMPGMSDAPDMPAPDMAAPDMGAPDMGAPDLPGMDMPPAPPMPMGGPEMAASDNGAPALPPMPGMDDAPDMGAPDVPDLPMPGADDTAMLDDLDTAMEGGMPPAPSADVPAQDAVPAKNAMGEELTLTEQLAADLAPLEAPDGNATMPPDDDLAALVNAPQERLGDSLDLLDELDQAGPAATNIAGAASDLADTGKARGRLRLDDLQQQPQLTPVFPRNKSKYLNVQKDYSSSSMRAQVESAQRALKEGRNSLALDLFDALYVKHPKDPRIMMGRAVALQKNGMNDEAVVAYEKVLKRDPRNVNALTNMLGLLRLTDPDAALTKLLDLKSSYPGRPAILAQLGMTYADVGDEESALRYLTMAQELEPEDPRHAFNMAVLLDRRGHRSDAIMNYKRALFLNSNAGGNLIPAEQIRQRLEALR